MYKYSKLRSATYGDCFRTCSILRSIHCATVPTILVELKRPITGMSSEHNIVNENKSELGLLCFCSALSFGASFEELANFLIDQVDANVETVPRTAIELSGTSNNDGFFVELVAGASRR